MLERIYEENWKELRIQMTDASSIPEAILALLADSEEEFEQAYWKIENHVVVQGDLYSAAAVVPKYLEEVYLRSKFKHGVSELLFQIGSGYSTDGGLMKTCFSEVIRVYKSLLANPIIQGTEFVAHLEEDLSGVIELHNDKNI
ncbi:hypothetical protein [Pseudoalteromonas luteoviolacea]|uniref:Uncharacterized protein n=1 Tax=Pseudoalteromonas luteoviolacea S4060-1 TaxID=1365257 RepID=A0A167PD85_9GAMM|nr:hypothetical protein [Pseudoalteromonas luteoviolacea]KZN70390.1 hypothetical protein N478_00370 [Pseudoalteromonas luteoviolacea S4060-1]